MSLPIFAIRNDSLVDGLPGDRVVLPHLKERERFEILESVGGP
jgi:hypothetical protein